MKTMKIEKVKLYYLKYIIFPEGSKESFENKDIEKIYLVPEKTNFIKEATFSFNNENEFKISLNLTNQSINEVQNKLYEKTEGNIKTKEELKKLKIIDNPELNITFNLLNINFLFYSSNFPSIINNNQKPELFIYLKKFNHECIITRKNHFTQKEYKSILSLFPYINTEDIVNNLKFHDVVFSFKLELKDLFDIIFKYENKFKIVKNILGIKNTTYLYYDEEIEEKNNIINDEENNDDDEDYYLNFLPLNTTNQDIIWLFLVLVSEHIITYYNLILSLNKYEKELNDIIDKNKFLFIIFLRRILRSKFRLSYVNEKIYLFNPKNFYNCIILNRFKNENQLNEEEKKEYYMIKNIYSISDIRNYYKYNLFITPISCEFKIPFLKTGIFLIDKFKGEFKSYDLIYVNFQRYSKNLNNKLRIDENIFKCYIYNILNKEHSLFNIRYSYIGGTADDIKIQKYWFIKCDNLSSFKLKNKIFNIKTENQYLYINELLFSEDIATYICRNKSIKKYNKNNNYELSNNGIISYNLKEKIRKGCKIHNFSSCFGIIDGFFGNFALINRHILNCKNRIIIKENITPIQGDKNILKDRTLYILNISRYKNGIIDNDSINVFNCLKNYEKKIESIINEIFKLNIENIYERVPINKLKLYLLNFMNKKSIYNKFLLEINKAFYYYHYNQILKNILEIPDSAILGGIFDEYNIMENITSSNYFYVLVILEKVPNEIKCLKGEGIIFKSRKNYINEYHDNKIYKIKFFDLEEFENHHKNPKYNEIIKNVKQIKNVVIFPKHSNKLLKNLCVDDISKQEFFISWNKDIIDDINIIDNIDTKQSEFNDNIKENEETKEYDKIKLNVIKTSLKHLLKYNKNISYMHKIATRNYFNNINKLNKINIYLNNKAQIDYKNITQMLYKNKNIKDLNNLELFYLEYIPKCTLAIKDIINKIKELLVKYSINDIINLLIGDINIEINSKKYINEIDNINDTLLNLFEQNLLYLINPFKYLKNHEINNILCLSQYKDRMFIITVIIYNICYEPEIIANIIGNYNKIIEKFVKNKRETDEKRIKINENDIFIKDYYESEADKYGIDYYLLFEGNKFINDKYRNIDSLYNDINKNEKSEKNDNYIYFFEDFKLLLQNKEEVKSYYIPELLLSKYLEQLKLY